MHMLESNCLSVVMYLDTTTCVCPDWNLINTPFETCSSLNNLHTKPWKTRQFSILNHDKIWMKRILTRCMVEKLNIGIFPLLKTLDYMYVLLSN